MVVGCSSRVRIAHSGGSRQSAGDLPALLPCLPLVAVTTTSSTRERPPSRVRAGQVPRPAPVWEWDARNARCPKLRSERRWRPWNGARSGPASDVSLGADGYNFSFFLSRDLSGPPFSSFFYSGTRIDARPAPDDLPATIARTRTKDGRCLRVHACMELMIIGAQVPFFLINFFLRVNWCTSTALFIHCFVHMVKSKENDLWQGSPSCLTVSELGLTYVPLSNHALWTAYIRSRFIVI